MSRCTNQFRKYGRTSLRCFWGVRGDKPDDLRKCKKQERHLRGARDATDIISCHETIHFMQIFVGVNLSLLRKSLQTFLGVKWNKHTVKVFKYNLEYIQKYNLEYVGKALLIPTWHFGCLKCGRAVESCACGGPFVDVLVGSPPCSCAQHFSTPKWQKKVLLNDKL